MDAALTQPAISLLPLCNPTVTVEYDGDYGLMRVIGVLMEAPESPLRVLGPGDLTRQASFFDLALLRRVRFPTAELPIGAYSVILSSDEAALPSSATPGTSSNYNPLAPTTAGAVITLPARLGQLPAGAITVTGEPYGVLRVPTRRISELRMEPVSGTLAQAPTGSFSLEIQQGDDEVRGEADLPRIVTIPFLNQAGRFQIERWRRDVARRLLQVVLADGQVFTGRLVDLPDVDLQVAVNGQVRTFRLADLAQFEASAPVLDEDALGTPGLDLPPTNESPAPAASPSP
jgi:hypothetical protein